MTNYALKKGLQQEKEKNDQNQVWVKCRNCIGLDGCFLKGVCKGHYLSQLLKMETIKPIAWAVTEVEKKETWRWFMRILQDDLQLGNGDQTTLIIDMQNV
uniref:Putative ovule protein n=1 Tax=Solanum chacoense TaxID=4108 RepID=A0A0V0GPR9_SOLCH